MVTKWIAIIFITVISFTVINGCSTISGAGKDLQKAGQAIEKEANKK
jgi:predicted small secreted protein